MVNHDFSSTSTTDIPLLNLRNYEEFEQHPWTKQLLGDYNRDYKLATKAYLQVVAELKLIDVFYNNENGRKLFTHIDGRPKDPNSFLKKVFTICRNTSRNSGMTRSILKDIYHSIKDVCGVRFACAYYDDVKPAIENYIRPILAEKGYGTDLRDVPGLEDNNYLDDGNEVGYRSYHFYVKVPTFVDIFGENAELCICEIQGRSELQHVWASKSHDLLYKPKDGWNFDNSDIIEDMRQISNSLRVADHALARIRQEATKRVK